MLSQSSLKPDYWLFQIHDLGSQMERHTQRVQRLHRSVTGKLVLVLSDPEESFCVQGKLQLLIHSGVCVGVALFAA